MPATPEDSSLRYVIRLLSFCLILWAIFEKNWPSRKQRQAER
jgi:hypothetical protein